MTLAKNNASSCMACDTNEIRDKQSILCRECAKEWDISKISLADFINKKHSERILCDHQY